MGIENSEGHGKWSVGSRLGAMLPLLTFSLGVAVGVVEAQESRRAVPTFDLLFRDARVMDGTGNPWFRADVAVDDGRIVGVGDLGTARAKRTIDARGKVVVAPGFIDLHSHASGGLTSSDARRRTAPNLITQGITTVVLNPDGGGPMSISGQKRALQSAGIGPNAILMVGHNTIRRSVLGADYKRAATPAEIEKMRQLVRQGMDDGARGMTAGLEYVPGIWSTTAELVALVRVIAPYAGVFISHERSSGADPMWYLPSQHERGQPTMLDTVLELIDISEKTGATVVATHIKARGANFWGSSRAIVQLIDRARRRGVSIYADQYPYTTTGSDGRLVLIPAWLREKKAARRSPADVLEAALGDAQSLGKLRTDIAHEIIRRGGAENIVVMDHPRASHVGKSLEELAKTVGVSSVDMAIRLQLEGYRDRPGGARLRGFSLSEIDVEAFASRPWTATATDAGVALPDDDRPVHPRFYGTYPRKIRRYALERGVLTVEDAIRSSTSLPAQILGLRDRGQIREGFRADIVVLDLDRLRDRATTFEPHQYSEGVDHVLVGGVFVVEDGKPTGSRPGVVITRDSQR